MNMEVPAMVVQVSRKIKNTNIIQSLSYAKQDSLERNKLSTDVRNRVKNEELAWIDEIEYWNVMD